MIEDAPAIRPGHPRVDPGVACRTRPDRGRCTRRGQVGGSLPPQSRSQVSGHGRAGGVTTRRQPVGWRGAAESGRADHRQAVGYEGGKIWPAADRHGLDDVHQPARHPAAERVTVVEVRVRRRAWRPATSPPSVELALTTSRSLRCIVIIAAGAARPFSAGCSVDAQWVTQDSGVCCTDGHCRERDAHLP